MNLHYLTSFLFINQPIIEQQNAGMVQTLAFDRILQIFNRRTNTFGLFPGIISFSAS